MAKSGHFFQQIAVKYFGTLRSDSPTRNSWEKKIDNYLSFVYLACAIIAARVL
jgi:hypothetical protein